MGPDAHLSATSRPRGCEHTRINTHSHIKSVTVFLFLFVFLSEVTAGEVRNSPLPPVKPSAHLRFIEMSFST